MAHGFHLYRAVVRAVVLFALSIPAFAQSAGMQSSRFICQPDQNDVLCEIRLREQRANGTDYVALKGLNSNTNSTGVLSFGRTAATITQIASVDSLSFAPGATYYIGMGTCSTNLGAFLDICASTDISSGTVLRVRNPTANDASLQVWAANNGNAYAFVGSRGEFTWNGQAAPLVSPTGSGTLYFDSTALRFKISENAGAYAEFSTCVGGCMDLTNAQTAAGVKTFTSNMVHANDTKVQWKDALGTARDMLWLDGSNDFHVGTQAAVTNNGRTFFWADGFKRLILDSSPGAFYPETDFGIALGNSLNRFATMSASGATLYSKVIGAIVGTVSIQSADAVSFVSLRAATVGGSNYDLMFPATGPPGANRILESDASGNLSWIAAPAVPPFDDTTAIMKGSVTATKLLRIEVDGLSVGTRVWTAPDTNLTVAGRDVDNGFSVSQNFTAGILANNNTKMQWKDQAGTARDFLWVDGSNDFHVGSQADVLNTGRTFFWADGAKRLVLESSPNSLYPETDRATFLGSSTNRFADLRTMGVTVYSYAASGLIATVSLHSANATTFVNLRGATTGSANYNLQFPGGAPGANQILQSDASGNFSWIATPTSGLGDPAANGIVVRTALNTTTARTMTGVSPISVTNGSGVAGAPDVSCSTCLTTNTTQTITGTKTWDLGFLMRQSGDSTSWNVSAVANATNSWLTFTDNGGTERLGIYRIAAGVTTNRVLITGDVQTTESLMLVASSAANALGSQGRIRYNSGVQRAQVSENSGAYVNLTREDRSISTTSPITGGGDFSANRTFACATCVTTDTTQTISGTKTFSAGSTFNGGISTASGTNSTIYIGGSGNFYIRTFSAADVSCTGVTDGWLGIRTDTNELQSCVGGVMKKVALI